jgi:hypothetical protein
MSAELETASIRPLAPSAIKRDPIIDVTDLWPDRPTTMPSFIVTPTVSAMSVASCLVSLTCVAVSACGAAGGGR